MDNRDSVSLTVSSFSCCVTIIQELTAKPEIRKHWRWDGGDFPPASLHMMEPLG